MKSKVGEKQEEKRGRRSIKRIARKKKDTKIVIREKEK